MADHPQSPGGTIYAVLDANALLPPRLSDVLFDLHGNGIYLPRWTRAIENEFLRNWARVVKKLRGNDLKAYIAAAPHPGDERKAERRLNAFRNAVGDEFELVGYDAARIAQHVPPAVNKGDVHVACAAIFLKHLLVSEGGASDKVFLVSSNVKHLAVDDMEKLGINVVRPGAFVDFVLKTAPERLGAALAQTVSDLVNPPYTKSDLLGALKLHGAQATVAHFRKAWNVRLPLSQNRQL